MDRSHGSQVERFQTSVVRALLFILPSAIGLISCSSLGFAQSPPTITHGIASGDITATTAVVWARADREAVMNVEYAPESGNMAPRQATTENSKAPDFTARLELEDLEPGTRYVYKIWFESSRGDSVAEIARFRTAPEPGSSFDVSLIWAGDLGGQGYCRQVGNGYSIFQAMEVFEPDFFIASGDMINADSICPVKGPEDEWVNIEGEFPAITDTKVDWHNRRQVESVYLAHWLYNRADPSFQKFLRSTPMYAQWDDHEVIDDFGASWLWLPADPERSGYSTIVDAGRKLLFDFHPIQNITDHSSRIYRSFQWGDALEVFILDTRSYRSENFLQDTAENAKTMLGAEQLKWLKDGLANSTATWKVISGGIPLSYPSGKEAEIIGRDSWANGLGRGYASQTGFERELTDLLSSLDHNNVGNVIFLAADTHFPAQVRHELDLDGDGDTLLFYEFISGPLSSGLESPTAEFDPSLRSEVLYSEGNIFNFGTLQIIYELSGIPILYTDIRDQVGGVRPGSSLELEPQGIR